MLNQPRPWTRLWIQTPDQTRTIRHRPPYLETCLGRLRPTLCSPVKRPSAMAFFGMPIMFPMSRWSPMRGFRITAREVHFFPSGMRSRKKIERNACFFRGRRF